jgi:glycosyltransferase involved in cell wall biosynthesis
VVTIHDLDFLQHPERTRDEIRRDYPSLVRRHAATAEGIIVPSAHVGGLVESELGVEGDVISVCPQGGPGWLPAPGASPGNTKGSYVLFIGTLEPRKNVHGLLDAYAALLTRWPQAPPLVLAGRMTPDSDRWLEAATRPPLAGRVEYRGYVPAHAKRELYEGARLLVLPSFDEGFGMPVIEAMSLGVPVVASDGGALPEVCGGAALLVNPNDRGSISNAIERVLADPALAERLGERGLVRAREFSWARTAGLTRNAYLAAIRRRKGNGK